VITEFPIEQPLLSENARERFTTEMLEALRKNYQCMKVFKPYYLYAPRIPIAGYGMKESGAGGDAGSRGEDWVFPANSAPMR